MTEKTIWIPLNNFFELLLNESRENFWCVQESITFPTHVCFVCFKSSTNTWPLRIWVHACVNVVSFPQEQADTNRETILSVCTLFLYSTRKSSQTKVIQENCSSPPLTICLWIPILWDSAPLFLFETHKAKLWLSLAPLITKLTAYLKVTKQTSSKYNQCNIFIPMWWIL